MILNCIRKRYNISGTDFSLKSINVGNIIIKILERFELYLNSEIVVIECQKL